MVTLDKHVGEMDADELSETLLKSDNRYVKQIQIQDVKIAEKLFDDTAERIAKTFIGKNSSGKKDYVSSSQLRKFFDEIKSFEKYFVSTGESKWEEKKPYIKMIKSKVAYAVARKGVKEGVYKNLEKFIIDGINQIKEEKDYFTFLSLFEAVYGFYCQVLLDNDCKLND